METKGTDHNPKLALEVYLTTQLLHTANDFCSGLTLGVFFFYLLLLIVISPVGHC